MTIVCCPAERNAEMRSLGVERLRISVYRRGYGVLGRIVVSFFVAPGDAVRYVSDERTI